jgi:phospholipid-binding lipoprotein MlaA
MISWTHHYRHRRGARRMRGTILALAWFLVVGSMSAAESSSADPKDAGATQAAQAAEDEEIDEYAVPQVNDPLERVNRTVFKFNDGLYTNVLRPFTRSYTKVVPGKVRRGFDSFFENLGFPVRFVGCALQGKLDRSAAETGKFLVNSTVGLAGFIKVSERIPELRVPDEDVGQALGKWGIGHGPFIVLPVFGPTTLRDLVGRAGDTVLSPTNWKFLDQYDWKLRAGLQLTESVNSLPGLLETYDSLRHSAVDPYVAFRNGYIQYRDAAVKQ